MRIYIGGKITGNPSYKRDFKRAANWLMERGHQVLNPVELLGSIDFSHEQCMEIDIAALKQCDGVYFLKGWEASEGARKEKETAEMYHIPIWYD